MQFSTNVSRTRPCCRKNGLAGLGFWEALASTAVSAFASGAGGSSGGSAMPAITVSPPITVSPQISPVFQQQFQPSGSSMSAGTSQTSAPVPGMVPGGAALPTGYAPGGIPMPAPDSTDPLKKYLPWMVMGVGAIVLVKVFQRQQQRKRVTYMPVK